MYALAIIILGDPRDEIEDFVDLIREAGFTSIEGKHWTFLFDNLFI